MQATEEETLAARRRAYPLAVGAIHLRPRSPGQTYLKLPVYLDSLVNGTSHTGQQQNTAVLCIRP
jgi:hypothetical protein